MVQPFTQESSHFQVHVSHIASYSYSSMQVVQRYGSEKNDEFYVYCFDIYCKVYFCC